MNEMFVVIVMLRDRQLSSTTNYYLSFCCLNSRANFFTQRVCLSVPRIFFCDVDARTGQEVRSPGKHVSEIISQTSFSCRERAGSQKVSIFPRVMNFCESAHSFMARGGGGQQVCKRFGKSFMPELRGEIPCKGRTMK